MTEPSVNFHAKYAAMCVSVLNILAFILHHANSEAENCFPLFALCFCFFYCIDSGLCYFNQAYNFLVVEEEFRVRRRNHVFQSDKFRNEKQNTQRRRRRAWLRPSPRNWFRSLLANPVLNFLWKKHFQSP